jgi:hypothetical protein
MQDYERGNKEKKECGGLQWLHEAPGRAHAPPLDWRIARMQPDYAQFWQPEQDSWQDFSA